MATVCNSNRHDKPAHFGGDAAIRGRRTVPSLHTSDGFCFNWPGVHKPKVLAEVPSPRRTVIADFGARRLSAFRGRYLPTVRQNGAGTGPD